MNPFRALIVSLSRMPPLLLGLIVVGLGCMVAMMVQSSMTESEKKLKATEAEIKAKYETKQKVVYAIKDIPEGATISADSLEEKDLEASKIPPNALATTSMAVGRIAKFGIATGSMVLSADLAPIGVSVGFDGKIKDGYRALTFAVDTNSGVAGFVAPGSHVDIIASVGSGAETKASPILSDVEVIAVGGIYQRSSGASGSVPASSVTVGVTPEDASKLIKAVMAGKLYLTLRNDKDHTPVAVTDVTSLYPKTDVPKSEVASLPPALPPPPLPGVGGVMTGGPAAPPPPPPLHEIEQWSGSKKDVLQVPKV